MCYGQQRNPARLRQGEAVVHAEERQGGEYHPALAVAVETRKWTWTLYLPLVKVPE